MDDVEHVDGQIDKFWNFDVYVRSKKYVDLCACVCVYVHACCVSMCLCVFE